MDSGGFFITEGIQIIKEEDDEHFISLLHALSSNKNASGDQNQSKSFSTLSNLAIEEVQQSSFTLNSLAADLRP